MINGMTSFTIPFPNSLLESLGNSEGRLSTAITAKAFSISLVSSNVSLLIQKFGCSIVVDLIVDGTEPSTSQVTSPIILSLAKSVI